MDQPLRPITEDEIATFERDGVVCLRKVLAEHWLTRMHDAVEIALGYSANLSTIGGSSLCRRALVDALDRST